VDRGRDESNRQWDVREETGLRFVSKVWNVEYLRDVKPILQRSCAACHTSRGDKAPAGKLDLDADSELISAEHEGKFPGTYYRLALDERARFGHKPVGCDSWGYPNASRYIRMLQSRRSLLVWKVFGARLDGFSNDDHPSEAKPGDGTLVLRGKKVDVNMNRHRADIDYTGSRMPPPDAMKEGKVQALSDEDLRTIARWIDLGCPIDLDYDPSHPEKTGYGWALDDQRPTLTLTEPKMWKNHEVSRILIGMHDSGSGLALASFEVFANFTVKGMSAGTNLAPHFERRTQGVWELQMTKPLRALDNGRVTISIKDRQGNRSLVDRRFSVEE
jgi:hypothetical protein